VSVLLAEDNVTNQILTSAILETAGMAVDVVSDGREALDALGRRPYDVVLMDGQMPELDGFAATRELRRREHGMWRTPVVALTASATREDRKRCLDAGMDDYLAKPVRRRALVDVVLRWAASGNAVPAGLRDEREVLPVLDPVVVGELRLLANGRPEFLAEIVSLFGDDLAPKVVELEIAHRLCDWEAVQRIAHRIRGAASQVGAKALDRVTARLELAPPEALANQAADLIEVQHEFTRANQALREALLAPVSV
jgi:CheY-like chemotaxis protein